MDETMLDSTPQKIRVLVPNGYKPLRIKSNISDGLHITLVFCVAADGDYVTPAVIFPLKCFPADCVKYARKFHWAGQVSGWITADIFRDWVIKVFIPHVNARRRDLGLPNERALLFLDSHASRRSPEALRALQGNNVDAFTFPSHTSHIIQPMDCGIHRAFKAKFKKSKKIEMHHTLSSKRATLIKKAAQAYVEALNEDTITEAWGRAGIYPWDVAVALGSPYVVPEVPPIVAQLVSKNKRRYLAIDNGMLTNNEVVDDIAEQQGRRKKRAAPKRRKRKTWTSESSNEDSDEKG